MEFNLKQETAIVEAILFLDSEPLNEDMISKISELSRDVVEIALQKLQEKYNFEPEINISEING